MNGTGSIRCAPAVFFLFGFILSAACLSIHPVPGSPAGSTVPTTAMSVQPACGFTNCHGLDLSCGEDVPEVCTALYQLGDTCRQYAYCSNASGSCELVETEAFTRCKSCIGKCGGGDAAEIFSCEERC